MNLHWDGNNVSLEERNRSAAMGTGITPPTGDRPSLKRVADWLRNLAAPPYPFKIDKELAAQGAPIYKKYCAECHGADGKDFRGEARRQSRADRRDRHGPPPPRFLHLRRRGQSKYDFRRLWRGAIQPFPQDFRLRQQSARWSLAAGALSAQRFGADLARFARAERSSGRKLFIAATMSTIRRKSALFPTSRRNKGRKYFLYNTDETAAIPTKVMRESVTAPSFRPRKKTLWSSISRRFEQQVGATERMARRNNG